MEQAGEKKAAVRDTGMAGWLLPGKIRNMDIRRNSMIRISELRMNYQKELMAVTEVPQFNWMIDSEARNVRQKAYQLQIAKEDTFQEIVYDSGRIESEESAHVEAEFEMETASRYFGRVKIWTESEETEFSPVCSFLSGVMNQNEWKACFVSPEGEEQAEESEGNYIRKEFEVFGRVKRAYLFTTALGLYQLWMNGEKIGNEELSPGWTSYRKHLLYQTHDVTEVIREGKNVIGAHVGAGWYKGVMGFTGNRNNYGNRTAFFGQLWIRYEDGTEEVVVTDPTWKSSRSPVVFAEIYDGEIYDASLEQPGWDLPGFDDSGWRQAEEISFDKTVLRAQTTSAVMEHEILPVKELFRTPEGDLCLDFGQNMAGWIHVHAAGKAGDEIELRCFETLDAAGNVYLDNLRKAKQRLYYRFGTDGEIDYHPSFTYQGFRYAKIVRFPGEPKAENFTAYAVYSDMEETGQFSCSHPGLNQLHKNVGWGLRSNFVDVPTDCPQRDERLGWTGDAEIFARTASYLRNTYCFYEKWLHDLACDQTPEGGVPHVIPDILNQRAEDDWLMSQGDHSAAAWADAAVIIPWSLYLNYGDTRLIRKQYGSMKAWIDFMRAHSDGNIWNFRLQFGDWVALDAEEGSYFGATPNDLTCTAYYAYSTRLFARMSGLIGKTEEEKEYTALYEQIRDTFHRTFLEEDGTMTAQTQTAHILALHFDLVEEKYRQKTINRLLELLAKENGHLVTGFVGTPYFCHALSGNGHTKEAYELLLKEDFPSWLYQVKMGATTVWEHWDGIRPDGTMWSPDMNSFNHYAYGAVEEWMFRVMGGIDTDEEHAGFRHSILYPQIGGGITSTLASYQSPYGRVRVEWKVSGSEVEETIEIPHNTTATVKLYQADSVQEDDGLAFEEKDGIIQAEAGSGVYRIRYRLS